MNFYFYFWLLLLKSVKKMSTDLKASDKFAKLPLSFAQQFEEKLIPFLQEEHRDLAIETALSLFNQAIWKLQPKSWVLEQVTEGGVCSQTDSCDFDSSRF